MGYFDAYDAKVAAPVAVQVATPAVPAATGGVTPYGRQALASEAEQVASAAEGQRNDALNRAYFRMARLVPEHLTLEAVRDALANAGRASGLPDWEIALVLREDASSAATAGQQVPRTIAALEAPNLHVVGTEVEEQSAAMSVRERFPIIDWHELWAREDNEEWIVEPVLPARRLVALFSPPKVGKSLLMLEMAVAVARGTPVLGSTPDRPRRVLYVDFENDPVGDVRDRLWSMGEKPDNLENLCYLTYPSMAKFDTLAGSLDLMAAVSEYECEVVIIDTISRAVGGEENKNDTWLDFYRHSGLALKQAGIACIRLDHTGKDSEKGMRGGSAKYGDVDAVWKLSTVIDGELYHLECTDHRMMVAEKELTLKRLTGPLRHVVDADGKAAIPKAKARQVVAKLDELGVPADAGRRACAEALKATDLKVRGTVIDDAIKTRKLAAGVLWKGDE